MLITVLFLFIFYFYKMEEDDCVYLNEYEKTCEENFFMRYDISNKQVIDGWFVKNNSSQIPTYS